MSQINDALKKARQAHAATPSTAAGPELRPLRNPSGPPRRAIFTSRNIALMACVLAGVAGWIWFGLSDNRMVVRANSLPSPVNSPSAPAVEVSTPPALPAISNTEPAPIADAAPLASETPTAPVLVAAAGPAVASDSPVIPVSPAVETSGPPPAPLNLQGLLYRPGNPVAIIDGQTVSIGSHVGDAGDERVVAIDQHSVTIVTSTGRTNVLEMTEH